MRVLRKGDSGEDVTSLSAHLVVLGLIESTTDTFDAPIERAVTAWQAHGVDAYGRKLAVDGIVGAKTWDSFTVSTDDVFTEPVPTDFYPIPKGGSEIGRTALRVGMQEMWNGARELNKNNAGEFVQKYLQRDDADELQWSWCAGFVSWCYMTASEHLEVSMPFKYTGGAQNLYNQIEKKGGAYEASKENPPMPGDICTWWRGETKGWQGHVGMVWGYNNGMVYVLEGNAGRFPARVRVFDYVLDDMPKFIGFARIKNT